MSSSLMRNVVNRFFPPPLFLQMPAMGLDISDEVVRCVDLRHSGSRYKIQAHAQEVLSPDIIQEGYIKNMNACVDVLSRLQKKYSLRYIRATLPEEKAYLFKTQIPHMDEADIRGALEFKIEENVPLSRADAVFDYEIIPRADPDSLHIDVAVTVVDKNLVSQYVDVCKKAHLTPLSFHTEGHALCRVAIAKDDHDAHIVVGIRETKTVFAIVYKNVVHFTSTIPVGGESIANSLKKQLALSDQDVQGVRLGTVTKDSNDMFMALVNASSVVRDEIQKLFSYWQSHAESQDQKEIKSIILAGADVLLGFDTYLAQAFSVPLQIADPWKNIPLDNAVPVLSRHEALDFMPALGLVI